MTEHSRLYTYRCRACKTVMTTPIKAEESPYWCRTTACGKAMTYMWSEPITTDAERALAARGIVFNPHFDGTKKNRRPCDECKTWVEQEALIRIGTHAKVCSEKCGNVWTEKHRIWAEGFEKRMEKLYTEMPWLRPAAKKETA